ncbi:MAG TPA: tail protein X [Chitinophagaceae bacterium]|nr:tail protein X [Chitinophagaceae bacterium]
MGALEKMTLTGYKDQAFEQPTGFTYEALINPESYSLVYALNVNNTSAQGASLPTVSFNQGEQQTLNFKFLFDGTGVVRKDEGVLAGLASGLAIPGVNATTRDVTQDLATFKSVVYDYQGETHQPPYVKIEWGVLSFNAVMTRMNITFKLFKPDGSPLRAEADCTFTAVIDQGRLTALENKQSPDLTHIRTVLEGDTLPLLCFREYGDSKYYLQVAQANGLTDIKQLTPGTKLIFPRVTNN